jgi:hypothetical protein
LLLVLLLLLSFSCIHVHALSRFNIALFACQLVQWLSAAAAHISSRSMTLMATCCPVWWSILQRTEAVKAPAAAAAEHNS